MKLLSFDIEISDVFELGKYAGNSKPTRIVGKMIRTVSPVRNQAQQQQAVAGDAQRQPGKDQHRQVRAKLGQAPGVRAPCQLLLHLGWQFELVVFTHSNG